MGDYIRSGKPFLEIDSMARFKIGDRVRINITIGGIYDKAGTIADYAQKQYYVSGQLSSMPNWKVRLDDGEIISINEMYLNPYKERRR